MDLNTRLKTAKDKAGLSTADMATWFDDVGQSTMRTWLSGVEPYSHRHTEIDENLKLLEAAIAEYKHFPVPLRVTQFTRKEYIREVKNGIIARVRESRPASGGHKVLGSNKESRKR